MVSRIGTLQQEAIMPHPSVHSLQPDLFPDLLHETPGDETLAIGCWTDGLVTAAAVGPEGVETAELLELVWEMMADPDNARMLSSHIENSLAAMRTEIVEIMRSGPTDYEPAFAGLPNELDWATIWSDGFQATMTLRPAAWEALACDPRHAFGLLEIMLLTRDDDEVLECLRPKARGRPANVAKLLQQCADDVGLAVAGIYRHWHDRPPATRAVGRNDPCPCGSGRKYKKCCLR
jgi:uncharacterized protein